MELLPPRPFVVQSRFILRNYGVALLLGLLGLAITVGAAVWQGGVMRSIVQENELWKSGEEASWNHVSGQETSHNFILNSYRLDVKYRDGNGATHTGKSEFDSLFKSVDSKVTPEVHFDPKLPERYALSWAIDLGWSRWASCLFFLAVGGLLGIGLLVQSYRLVRDVIIARHAAERSEEAIFAVLSVMAETNRGRKTGMLRYRYRTAATASSPGVERSVRFNGHKGHFPLFADTAKTHVIALVSPHQPTRPVVLRHDFYPFAFSMAESESIRQKIATEGALPAQVRRSSEIAS